MIKTFPVVGWDHPVWTAILKDDLPRIQAMLSSGTINLTCQCPNGMTLLSVARVGSPEICEFLICLGLRSDYVIYFTPCLHNASSAHFTASGMFLAFDKDHPGDYDVAAIKNDIIRTACILDDYGCKFNDAVRELMYEYLEGLPPVGEHLSAGFSMREFLKRVDFLLSRQLEFHAICEMSEQKETGFRPQDAGHTVCCKNAIRLRGATGTGVDEEDLVLPYSPGCRYRRYWTPGPNET
ncbi:hypothetical protein BCR34DRAFT_668183 [Clohesyomyces aquaticus]|uniref:Uncharacterized protein n=1 Tax=Clohesyomyces aquaticus TaxID=1231657 RepID=A0A1Y1YRG1_9PLEO|nr:hypothetical protein BCR34DRAFT_668183 [Clohesyomyces aquaticus]